MSYILEALRKADAERERGAVPDLHAQLLPAAPPDDEGEAHPGRRWGMPVLVALLVSLALMAWLSLRQGATPSTAPPPPTQVMPSAAPALPPVATAVQPLSSVQSAPPVQPSASQPAAFAQVPGPRPVPAPARAPVKTESRRVAPIAPPTAAPRAEMPVPRAAPPTAKASEPQAAPKGELAAPAARLPALSELPEDLRRQMPPLTLGGSVYSTQPEKRMVIVNGQVFLEGATLAPELRLEQIRPKSAVFSIRGQRFEMPL
jgi:general secretion pathway protein B